MKINKFQKFRLNSQNILTLERKAEREILNIKKELKDVLLVHHAKISLLYQYRHKVGRLRYFVFTSIPLIYYLFPLQDYFGNVFSPLVLSSPIAFGAIYVLIFSATKQIGALLFSLAFCKP